MPQKAVKIAKSTKFEDALGELETIVKTLEAGDQPLDTSLGQFERGVALARFCQQSLAAAEQKVKVLTDDSGEEMLEEFDTDGE